MGVRYPSGRGSGPGFLVAGLFVWGFTAGLLSWLLDLSGLARPWDETPVVDHEGSPLGRGELVSGSLVLDLLLVLLLVGYAGSGFRQGLFVGALSLRGSSAGASAPPGCCRAGRGPGAGRPTRSLVVLGGTLVAGVVGQALLGVVAGRSASA